MTSVSRVRVILAGIVGVGALVRLYRLDLTWYFLDQVRDVSTAQAIASGKAFPLLGPLIGWTHGRLGPLYFYLIAPPFLLTGAPLAGPVFVALAGVLAVLLAYGLARDLFGSSVALAASAFFAVFPLAVLSSRVLWNPALIPLFTVLFMRALFAVVVRGRSSAIIGVWAFLAILMQLHLTTVSLGLVALLALLVWRPRLRLAHVLEGLAVFLALYAPYLIHEVGHGFENTRAILGVVGAGGGAAELALVAVVKNLLTLDRGVLDSFRVAEPWPPGPSRVFSILYGVEALAFTVGLVVCLGRLVRGSGEDTAAERRSIGLLVLWLVVPVVLLGSRRTALWWYYFDLLYPSQFIVAAIGLSWIAAPAFVSGRARWVLARAAVGLVLAIVTVQAWFQIGLQQRVDAQGEIRLDVPRLSVASAGSSLGTLSLLPYGYRYRILQALIDDFGLDVDRFAGRVHGSVLGLPEENDDLLRYLAARAPVKPTGETATPFHYLVIRDAEASTASSASRRVRIGPYLIVEYRPTISYHDWDYALVSGADRGALSGAGWQHRPLPAANVAALRPGQALAWRGGMRVPAGGEPVRVAVIVSGEAPLDVIRAESDGRTMTPIARRSWQSPSLYSTTEALFETPVSAGTADESILFVVGGSGRVMRVDLYEPAVR